MQEPVGHTREIRLEFLVKLYLARRTDLDLVRRLIAEQIGLLEDIEAERVADEPDAPFTRAVRELRLAQTRTALSWLRELNLDA